MADRLTASVGKPSANLTQRRQASLPVEMPSSLISSPPEFESESIQLSPPVVTIDSTAPAETNNGGASGADAATSAATELLLKRIQELVDRAQQADEQLQIERRFAELYKRACEEKEDQLAERVRRLHTSFIERCLLLIIVLSNLLLTNISNISRHSASCNGSWLSFFVL